MDAAHYMPRTTGSHTPLLPLTFLLPNHSDSSSSYNYLSYLSNFSYYHPAIFMAMAPYPYHQYSHYHIMMHNFLIAHPFYYGLRRPYARSAGIQRPLPPQDPEVYPKIMRQIEYYFSEENLITDTYLKNKMVGLMYM